MYLFRYNNLEDKNAKIEMGGVSIEGGYLDREEIFRQKKNISIEGSHFWTEKEVIFG
jgi:hypothetical protein